MEIHQECKKRLVEVFKEIIPGIQVQNNIFLDYKTLPRLEELDEILPNTGELKEQAFKYIGEKPLSVFIKERLSEKLRNSFEFDSNQKSSLTELTGFNDPESLANEIITEFESLPWDYALFLKLPKNLGTKLNSLIDEIPFNFNDQFSFCRPSNDIYPNPPKHGSLKQFPTLDFLKNEEQWNEEDLYIKFDTKGYIGLFNQTYPVLDFQDLVKSFLGISIAIRIIDFENSRSGSNFESKIVTYHNFKGDWQPKFTLSFSESFSNEFEKLDIWSTWMEKYDEDRRKRIIIDDLSKIKKVFSNINENHLLLRASQWFYDSFCNENDLLAFVQSITCIEILLGDKTSSDIIGIGELLRNRCAYLIGDTKSQRNEILNDFKRIYDTRSKIVHRGKNRLNASERNDLYRLRWLCLRSIQEEVKLLNEESDNHRNGG